MKRLIIALITITIIGAAIWIYFLINKKLDTYVDEEVFQEQEIERGVKDPIFELVKIDEDKVAWGTTIFAELQDPDNPRIVEINMLGEVIWEYYLPDEVKTYTSPGMDVEVLENNNVLLMLPQYAVWELDREGNIVWEYYDEEISHDADRLDNGNTLVVYGAIDKKGDDVVKEITPNGNIVWSWSAWDHFKGTEFENQDCQGYAHTNAAQRLENGNTMISLRNFNLIVEVDAFGEIQKYIGENIITFPHDPNMTEDGSVTVASQYPLLNCGTDASKSDLSIDIHPITEIDPDTNEILWEYDGVWKSQLTRDVDKLSNGNILVTGTDRLIEIDPSNNKVIWEIKLNLDKASDNQTLTGGFYKAERIED